MSEQQRPRDPLSLFTFVGRLLVLVTLLLVGGMFYWFVMFVNDKAESGILPSGHYSVAFLLIPAVIVALIFFVVVSFILERVGIRIYSKSNDRITMHNHPAAANPATTLGCHAEGRSRRFAERNRYAERDN